MGNQTMTKKKSLTPDRIMQFAWGYAPTLAIEAAVRHGFFNLLDKGPLTAAQIAARTRTSQRGVKAIVDVLVSFDLLRRKGDRFALAPESAAFLVSTKPSYYGTFFGHISDQLLPSWLQLSEIVRTGRPATKVNAKTEGAKFFAGIRRIDISAQLAGGQRPRSPPKPSKGLDAVQRAGHWRGVRRLGHRPRQTIASSAHPRRGLARGFESDPPRCSKTRSRRQAHIGCGRFF